MSAHYNVGTYRITHSNRRALACLRDGKSVHSAQLVALQRSGLADEAGTVYDEVLEAFNKAFPIGGKGPEIGRFFCAERGV